MPVINLDCIGGGKEIERWWLNNYFMAVNNKLIADFGAINWSGEGLAYKEYGINRTNETVSFDIQQVEKLKGQYIRADISQYPIYKNECFDIGLCISTLEHVGLSAYGNERLNDSADNLSIHAMWETIKPGGKLIISVPVGNSFEAVDGWVKIYTPKIIQSWKDIIHSCCMQVSYFSKCVGGWDVSCEKSLNARIPNGDINNVAIVEMVKTV